MSLHNLRILNGFDPLCLPRISHGESKHELAIARQSPDHQVWKAELAFRSVVSLLTGKVVNSVQLIQSLKQIGFGQHEQPDVILAELNLRVLKILERWATSDNLCRNFSDQFLTS